MNKSSSDQAVAFQFPVRPSVCPCLHWSVLNLTFSYGPQPATLMRNVSSLLGDEVNGPDCRQKLHCCKSVKATVGTFLGNNQIRRDRSSPSDFYFILTSWIRMGINADAQLESVFCRWCGSDGITSLWPTALTGWATKSVAMALSRKPVDWTGDLENLRRNCWHV